jgi:amino acid permease
MDKLSSLNIIGVTAIAMLAAVAAGLGIQSRLAGSAHYVPLLPQWPLLGPTTSQQLQALTAVMPVMIACYVAHQSLHPLMPLLRPYSDGRMYRVIAAALAISFAVFTTLAVGSSLAFGPDLDVRGDGSAAATPFIADCLCVSSAIDCRVPPARSWGAQIV